MLGNLLIPICFNIIFCVKFESLFNSFNPKNPRENCEYFGDKRLIKFLKPNLNFLFEIDLMAAIIEREHFPSKIFSE